MVLAPPIGVIRTVEQWAPGIYRDFLGRLLWALRDQSVMATSWYRSVEENRRVGGHPSSQHLIGLGVDIYPTSEAILNELRWSGLVVVPEPRHVHVQAWPAGVAEGSGLLRAAVGV